MTKPRDYQKDCLKALAGARAEGKKKALVVMASGLGKTLTATFDVKNYLKTNPSARILVLCPSVNILRQTKEVFKTEFGDEYSYGLYNGTEKARRKTDFVFAKLRSVDLYKENFGPKDFDYIIVDEVHHSATLTYWHSIEYFDPDFILGLTATPDWMDERKLDQFFSDEPVYSKDLATAVKEGLLPNIDYYAEMLEKLQWLTDKLGHVPTKEEINNCKELPSYNTYLKRFGSYSVAISVAGLSAKIPFRHKSNDDLLGMLRKFSEEIGRPPKGADVNMCECLPSVSTFFNRFKTKSWNDILKIAGIECKRRSPNHSSDEELLILLRKKVESLGYVPSIRKLYLDLNMPSPQTYIARFGRWSDALLKAGVPREWIRSKTKKK